MRKDIIIMVGIVSFSIIYLLLKHLYLKNLLKKYRTYPRHGQYVFVIYGISGPDAKVRMMDPSLVLKKLLEYDKNYNILIPDIVPTEFSLNDLESAILPVLEDKFYLSTYRDLLRQMLNW